MPPQKLPSYDSYVQIEPNASNRDRLTELFFRSKTTQITRPQPAIVVTGSQ